MQEIANCHFLIRVWADAGKVYCEEDFIHLFEPSLVLELKENRRPIEDWFLESFTEALLYNVESYIPENIEICEEPILIEVIGTVNVTPYRNSYYEEYDEDVELEIHFWSVALDEREEPLYEQQDCEFCGGTGSVGRCCGYETREPLNEAARQIRRFDIEKACREKLKEHTPYKPSTGESS